MLPPFFLSESNGVASSAVNQVFPTLPEHLKLVGRFCLASLVHHRVWITQNLNPNHRIFNNILFTSSTLLDQLQPFVVCRGYQLEDPITATGIPNHVSLLIEMRELRSSNTQLISELRSSTQQVITSVIQELEDRAIQARAITPDHLSEALEAHFTRVEETFDSRLSSWLQNASTQTQSRNNNTQIHTEDQRNERIWNGGPRLLPDGYRLPKCPPSVAFQYWCFGDPHRGIPPLNRTKHSDFSNKDSRKRFSDFSFLMKKMEEMMTQLNKERPREESPEAQQLFIELEYKLIHSIDDHVSRKRTTRPFERTWQTVTRQLREKKKRSD